MSGLAPAPSPLVMPAPSCSTVRDGMSDSACASVLATTIDKYCYLTSRAAAFKDADLILVVGTRMNYVIGNAAPPRWNANAKIVRIDIDPVEIATAPRKLDVGVVADAKVAFGQLTEAIKGKVTPASYETWRERLRSRNVQKTAEAEQMMSTNQSPVHPLRLCKGLG